MNARAPCEGCGAALAVDQHYCVECGARIGPPLALPYLAPEAAEQRPAVGGFVLPMPIQMATTCAALALGFGVVVGTAISPNLAKIIAGPAPIVAEAQPSEPTPVEPTPAGPIGGGGPAPVDTGTTIASTETTDTTGGGGGGGKKKRKRKQPQPDNVPIDGWVVQVNPNAVSFTVAKLSGSDPVTVVHTERTDQLPAAGTGIVTVGRRLFNNTLREIGPRTLQGSSSTASITGIVTYSDVGVDNATDPADEEAFTVSSSSASLLVRIPVDGGSPLASEVDPPPLGAQVTVPVEIRSAASLTTPLELTPAPPAPAGCAPPPSPLKPSPAPTHVLELGPGMGPPTSTDSTSASIEAVVQANCAGAGKVLFSADAIRERGVDLELSVPGGIDISRYAPGQSVVANVALTPGVGPSAITGIASDTGITGARDNLLGQGDMAGPPVDDVGPPKAKKKKKKRKKKK
jgi:hypothetical protein